MFPDTGCSNLLHNCLFRIQSVCDSLTVTTGPAPCLKTIPQTWSLIWQQSGFPSEMRPCIVLQGHSGFFSEDSRLVPYFPWFYPLKSLLKLCLLIVLFYHWKELGLSILPAKLSSGTTNTTVNWCWSCYQPGHHCGSPKKQNIINTAINRLVMYCVIELILYVCTEYSNLLCCLFLQFP